MIWNELLHTFWSYFEPKVLEAFETMEKNQKETGELCPECGSPLIEKFGKYGKFVACSNYPTCKYIKKEPREVKEFGHCPDCKDGTVVEIERPLQISNVQLLDAKTGKGTKIGFVIKDGKKVRVARKSGDVIVPMVLEATKEEADVVAEKVEKKK
jgi:ribosomal protein L24